MPLSLARARGHTRAENWSENEHDTLPKSGRTVDGGGPIG